MLKIKVQNLEDKYLMNEKVDIFTNTNKYLKRFIRVNIYLKDKDLTKTFNYSEKGYKEAVEFINKFEKVEV